MIRQFAAGLLELAAEALRPPVPTQGQEDLAEAFALTRQLRDELDACHADRMREKARADAAEEANSVMHRAVESAMREMSRLNSERLESPARIAELEQQLAQGWKPWPSMRPENHSEEVMILQQSGVQRRVAFSMFPPPYSSAMFYRELTPDEKEQAGG